MSVASWSRRRPAGVEVDLEAKVAFLSRPASYPRPTTRVEAVETHMAWVFLTDRYAYKLKKPVRLDFLDFSTLAARRRMADAEVRLNRRLAPLVYLDVVPLTSASDGGLAIGGRGSVVDWLVWMRRLPRRHLLDERIRAHDLPFDRLERLGEILAGFYRTASPVEVSVAAYVRRLRRQVRENRAVTIEYGLDPALIESAFAPQLAFLREHRPELAARVHGGRIVEGHGDLRPEHICLLPEPVVIDCVEFNRRFREVDPADDLALLSLECIHLGAPEAAEAVWRGYEQASGDRPPEVLRRFYRSARAGLRAKLALWHLRDAGTARASHWTELGERYLALAAEITTRPAAPRLDEAAR